MRSNALNYFPVLLLSVPEGLRQRPSRERSTSAAAAEKEESAALQQKELPAPTNKALSRQQHSTSS
jgi:hypothetical protein